MSGENARNQQPMTDLEKKVAFVFREFDMCIRAGGAGEFLHFVHGLLWDKNPYFAIQPGKFVIGFRQRQAVAIRGHHRQRVGFQGLTCRHSA